jgi:hypothetical protein
LLVGEIMVGRSIVVHGAARIALAATCASLLGCDGELTSAESAQQLYLSRAWPALGRCAGCHATRPTIDFLAPGTAAEAYPMMFAFQPPILDVASPASSLVLTMGKHTGPALLPDEADAILAWLAAEHTERVPDPGLAVAIGPVALALGAANTVDLGLGATLAFVPSPAAAGLALRQLVLTAGPRGLHAVHPLLVTDPPQVPPRIDTRDTFGDVDVTLAAGASVALGGGSAALAFDPGDPITIYFRTLEAP